MIFLSHDLTFGTIYAMLDPNWVYRDYCFTLAYIWINLTNQLLLEMLALT
jgi:hypothetical protein